MKFQPPEPPPAASAPKTEAAEASLEVVSTPDGADIQLDGVFVGSTPSTITVATGDHVITLNKTGYAVWERKLRITGGGNVRVNAQLQQQTPPAEPK